MNPRPVAPATPFVGREPELATLSERLAAASAGHGSMVVLAGEPGIGKTRLAEEVAAQARAHGARALWGRCWEGEGAPAFWPWVQVIRAYLRGHEPEALRAELGPGGADIATLVPELRALLPEAPAPPALDPAQARFRLFDSITAFLAQAATAQPLVLILDDLHWADIPSLLLLEFLARDVADAHVLVVGSYRDVEVARGHPLMRTLANLARSPHVARLTLAGLTAPEVARAIAEVSGTPPPERLVTALVGETEGNPLFVTEMVRLLEADGRLAGKAERGAWSAERRRVPQTGW